MDSKGRVTIPQEFREELGDSVVLKRTRQGVLLLPGKKRDFMSEFLKLLQSEPKRTGKPTNPTPRRMKSIWNE